MFYEVVGKSMEPGYLGGQVVLVSKRRVKSGVRERDVVIALDPRDGRPILKRVGGISEAGVTLAGDNLSESTDSRTFGLVQKANIIGKIVMKFPKDLLIKTVPVLAFMGLMDSGYLTFKHFTGGEVACDAIPGMECDIVLGSTYSLVFGVPLALLGALYYLAVLVFGVLYLRGKEDTLLRLLMGATSVGFLSSLYLIYIQAFVLYAYCTFCIISALISTTLFISLLVMTLRKDKALNGMMV